VRGGEPKLVRRKRKGGAPSRGRRGLLKKKPRPRKVGVHLIKREKGSSQKNVPAGISRSKKNALNLPAVEEKKKKKKGSLRGTGSLSEGPLQSKGGKTAGVFFFVARERGPPGGKGEALQKKEKPCHQRERRGGALGSGKPSEGKIATLNEKKKDAWEKHEKGSV